MLKALPPRACELKRAHEGNIFVMQIACYLVVVVEHQSHRYTVSLSWLFWLLFLEEASWLGLYKAINARRFFLTWCE